MATVPCPRLRLWTLSGVDTLEGRMGRAWLRGTGGRRTLAPIVAMLASATLFAGGQAAAAARLDGAGAPRAVSQAAGRWRAGPTYAVPDAALLIRLWL